MSDSLYETNHPSLLFTRSELPGLRQKIQDGGHDNAAYRYIQYLTDSVYPFKNELQLLQYNYGMNVPMNLGIVAFIKEPMDTTAINLGREMTLYVADNYDPDNDVFYSPIRMRTLALGYDMFFDNSSDSVRTHVRDEIVAYMQQAITGLNYERWLHHPYVSNKSAMICAALGMAAICLRNEITVDQVSEAIARADDFFKAWHEAHLDPDGAYSEGAMYAGWSMRHLVYYFWARKRIYDGYDFSELDKVRNLEKWIAFTVLPLGRALTNNTNDAAYTNYALSRHHTYFDWAQHEWGSQLSAWLWERLAGPVYGHEAGILADKVATVLWNQSLVPQRPGEVLPEHQLWRHRGEYYYRTGWASDTTSDDVIFSFYSGKFQGGHAHEDQNSFTIYGYQSAFAVDHGYGSPAKESEGHNLVLIDGKGQHNAGGSIGTDGKITEHVLSDFADYILGDATAAYTTYSEFNRSDYPFPGDNWSWGYDGGNPVNFALRRVIVVHDMGTPPYFIIMDDIEKDGAVHRYAWRMHTRDDNQIDVGSASVRINGNAGFLDIRVLNPPLDSVEIELVPFDNQNPDPNSIILSMAVEAINPHFALCLLPANESAQRPDIAQERYEWGHVLHLSWDDNIEDIFLLNRSGGEVNVVYEGSGGSGKPLNTNAQFALMRMNREKVANYLVSDVSYLNFSEAPVIKADRKLNCAYSRGVIQIDQPIEDFVFYAPHGGEIIYQGESVPALNDNGFLVPEPSNLIPQTPDGSGFLAVWTYPNPFRETTNIIIELKKSEDVDAVVFDVNGRRVRTLYDDVLPKGKSILRWNGLNNAGTKVPPGFYFYRVKSERGVVTRKILVLR